MSFTSKLGSILLGLSLLVVASGTRSAWAQLIGESTGVIHVKSSLVILDVNVIDQEGKAVTTGLTKDDFAITEADVPRQITSFETPEQHLESSQEGTSLNIIVLDLLNSDFQDFAWLREQVRSSLETQSSPLRTRAELMVLGNESLQLVQGPTSDKHELISALDNIPAAYPYKTNSGFSGERFIQSLSALRQIALQNRGLEGRKNILWIGPGAPNQRLEYVRGKSPSWFRHYLQRTTDDLVESRSTLFLVYPPNHSVDASSIVRSAQLVQGRHDPFSENVNFGTFVEETGGKFFRYGNDIAQEIHDAEDLGSHYYSLAYKPQGSLPDDAFKQVVVSISKTGYRAVTKAGYYNPTIDIDPAVPTRPLTDIVEAVQSSLPLTTLKSRIESVVRHPDTQTVEVSVLLNLRRLEWEPSHDDHTLAVVHVGAAAMTSHQDIVASRFERIAVQSPTDNAGLRDAYSTRIHITLRAPKSVDHVRVVLQAGENKFGSLDISRAALQTAVQAPTPEPVLISRPPHERLER